MSAELDWDKMIICAKRAFTGDGLHRKCKMDGRVLTIELPAPERHWADCKARPEHWETAETCGEFWSVGLGVKERGHPP